MLKHLRTEKLDELTRCVQDGRAVAFVGSGLSAGAYISWDKLIDALCERCEIEKEKTDTKLTLAGKAKVKSPEAYSAVLTEEFSKEHPYIPRAYLHLIKCPFTSFVTVNFDSLLAQASADINGTQVLYNFKDGLNYSKVGGKSLFHLHGYVEVGSQVSQDDLILTDNDFIDNYKNDLIIPAFLAHLFTYSSVVFIGCTLQEDELREMLRICRNIRSKLEARAHSGQAPPHYILLPTLYTESREQSEPVRDHDKEKELNKMYQEIGVQVVRYDRDSPHDFKPVQQILECWSGTPKIKPMNLFDEQEPTL